MKNLSNLAALITSIMLVLGACSPATVEETATPYPGPVEAPEAIEAPQKLGNPASIYCEEQSGRLEMRTDAQGGQYGVCLFDDGSQCEEWAFFNGECQPGGKAMESNPEPYPEPPIGMANPASVYCLEQGGKLEIRTESQGGQYGVCIFPDGSECEEWAFFNGKCQPAGAQGPLPPQANYINEDYGFTLNIPEDWSIEKFTQYIHLKKGGFLLFIGFRWEGEEVEPFRTGMPEGEFQFGGTFRLGEKVFERRHLVSEGKVKVVEYGFDIPVGKLHLAIWLDQVELPNGDYRSVEIPAEVIAEVDDILATFTVIQ